MRGLIAAAIGTIASGIGLHWVGTDPTSTLPYVLTVGGALLVFAAMAE